jgi:amidohydrolase
MNPRLLAALLLLVPLSLPGQQKVTPGVESSKPVQLRPDPAHRAAIDTWLGAHLPDVVDAYKHIHANPEISFQELKTSSFIAQAMTKAGWTVTQGIGRTGLAAVLKNGDGPTVLIRGDMDALPVLEETGLPYASKVQVKNTDGTTVGAMHACGHDVHCATLIGLAPLLADLKSHWRGTVILIGQPAEEIGQGARAMIADGLFDKVPRPDYCLSLHVKHNLPVGALGYTSGYATSNMDSVDITIHGKGGHGARPQDTVDPIVTAAHVITALQTIVSRRINPMDSAVVTVGSIKGGTKHNIIPDEVKMQLTVRSYSDKVRKQLLDGIRQITTDTCKAFGCPKAPDIAVNEAGFTPSMVNDPALTAAAMELFTGLVGKENIVEFPAEMGGEDFGLFAQTFGVPSLQYRVGSIARAKYEAAQKPGTDPLPTLHSPLYFPEPEPTVRLAVESMANLAMSLLPK